MPVDLKRPPKALPSQPIVREQGDGFWLGVLSGLAVVIVCAGLWIAFFWWT